MANVEFNSVKKSTYDGYGAPGGKGYDAGALYFIKDNGEIRKGDKHVTGARVYTATDPDGTTAVDALPIKLDGTDISTEGFTELPKKGDMLLVEQYLSLKDETYWEKDGEEVSSDTEGATQKTRKVRDPNGTKGYSSYVYAHNGPITITEDVEGTPTAVTYAYHPSGWQACCENVDASKVILTQDITMAGNYDKIGNFTKSTSGKKTNFIDNDTKGTSGVSVYELIRQMLQKTIEPTWQSNPLKPSVSLNTPSAGDKEYGEQANVTFQATFNKVYAQYDGGNMQYANNSPTYKFDDDTTGSSTNTIEKSWTAGVQTPPTTSVTVAYTASTNVPTNNLGVASTTINPQTIAAGTTDTATKTATINVYRKCFYKAYSFANKLSDADIKALTSADIRANNSGWTDNKNKPTSWTYTDKAQFIILVPQADTKQITAAETANGLPFTFTKLKAANGTDDYTVSINGYNDTANTGANYVVWVDNEGSNSSNTINITWG